MDLDGEDEDDPLQWWKRQARQWPQLALVARSALSIPGQTVDVERLFSEAGYVFEKRRAKMHPETLETFLFLHENKC